MGNDPQQKMVLAWYSKDQWKLLKKHAVDAHLLDDSYDDWLEQMDQLTRQLHQNGNAFVKLFVDAEELELWCQKVSIPNDAKARSRYVVLWKWLNKRSQGKNKLALTNCKEGQ